MALLFYHASHEHFAPSHLLELVVKAEQAGFEGFHSSDHFYPWSKRQGQSGFAFSWVAAALQATTLPCSMVCAPGQRLHPAIVAQAIATIAEMYPERFCIELGSGEALNEMITGEPWPEKKVRNERLQQCAIVIRRMLSGEEVNFSGHVKVREAKLYTLPLEQPLLLGAAISDTTAGWLGTWADGLLTTAGEVNEVKKKVDAFRNNGGAGKPVHVQFAFSYAREKEQAVMGAWDQWRSNLVGTDELATFSKPEQFDEATHDMTPEAVVQQVPIYTSMAQLIEMVKAYEQAFRPDRIILHNVNRLQEAFIEDFANYKTAAT